MSLFVRAFNTEHVLPPSNYEGFEFPENFRDGSPVDLEVGCGVGWHPIKYAQSNPDRRLIAIEHTKEKFESFMGRVERHSLSNLLPVHADAVRWVTHFVRPETIDRVLILYPNPEPGNSSKRWLRAPFFQKLLEVLKPGGEITLATNIESYFKEAIAYGQEFWKLEIKEQRRLTQPAPAGLPRTHFEKKYLSRGETCFDVTFRRP
ncbi:MAG: SAM-dependent methyltransferase [Bdellovibrionota bacterium]